jgi:energy-coupling factor transporter ATP-binding protein EcfA2
MAALSAAAAILGALIPFAALLSLLATVPIALLAYRYRLGVVIASTVAGCTIAFLVSGTEGMMTVANCAYVGGLTGIVKRRKLGVAMVLGAGAAAGAVLGTVTVAALAALTHARMLMLDSMTATVQGAATILRHIPRLAGLADILTSTFAVALRYWPALLIGSTTAGIVVATFVGWWALSRVLTRLAGIPDVHEIDVVHDDQPVGPVPTVLRDVRFRYPHADHDALGPLSMSLRPGEHLAITGANGSGKTTLMLVLAGRAPTAGVVERAGGVGLGRHGGTAVIMQHAESQVLGTRVRDDVVWGLPPGAIVDVDGLLAEVGLNDMRDRDTDGLSGGELQRLAVAAALARQPALLIADEVTSMVDQTGRDELLTVLSKLTSRHQMSLAHITHYRAEADSAERIVRLGGDASADAGRRELVHAVPTPRSASVISQRGNDSPVFALDGVWYEYSRGTPWARVALRDVTFAIDEGEGVLIHGVNGSGKSTLAWLMAGLAEPSAGTCRIDGRPAAKQVGAVAMSFQAARLQLIRKRVDLEIASAAGFDVGDRPRIEAALGMVGLDPSFADRRIARLSGGQLRRVALAGLLARNPRALILDEPLAGLDAATADGLVGLLADLRRTGLTIVVISHDFSGLEEVCPRTLHLDGGALAQPVSNATGVVR